MAHNETYAFSYAHPENSQQTKIMCFLSVSSRLRHSIRPDNLEIQFPFNKLIDENGFGWFLAIALLFAPKFNAAAATTTNKQRQTESTMRQIGEIINLTQM